MFIFGISLFFCEFLLWTKIRGFLRYFTVRSEISNNSLRNVMNKSHLHTFFVVNILNIAKIKCQKSNFCWVISYWLNLISWQIPSPACSFHLFNQSCQLTKPVDATLHSLTKLYNKDQNHLNLDESSLASLPFPFDRIASANILTILFLKSVVVALLTTPSESSISIFTFILAFNSLILWSSAPTLSLSF